MAPTKHDSTAPAKSRIPTFSSIEEAAEFWDTHDSTEFEDEWEEVTDVKFVAAKPKEALVLRFDDDILTELTEMARAQRTSPETMARRWILEKLGRA